MKTVLALRAGSQKARRIAVSVFDPRVHTLEPGEKLPVDADGDGHDDATGQFMEGNEAAAKPKGKKWR